MIAMNNQTAKVVCPECNLTFSIPMSNQTLECVCPICDARISLPGRAEIAVSGTNAEDVQRVASSMIRALVHPPNAPASLTSVHSTLTSDTFLTPIGAASRPTCFVSHSSQDSSFVETVLLPLLKTCSVEPWYSKESIGTAEH